MPKYLKHKKRFYPKNRIKYWFNTFWCLGLERDGENKWFNVECYIKFKTFSACTVCPYDPWRLTERKMGITAFVYCGFWKGAWHGHCQFCLFALFYPNVCLGLVSICLRLRLLCVSMKNFDSNRKRLVGVGVFAFVFLFFRAWNSNILGVVILTNWIQKV